MSTQLTRVFQTRDRATGEGAMRQQDHQTDISLWAYEIVIQKKGDKRTGEPEGWRMSVDCKDTINPETIKDTGCRT